ncbi:MAG: hypothetical protein N3A66_09870 [Planctomycetota bacterium]|nr:hypothetical protein [Planctomycetota bacterium]
MELLTAFPRLSEFEKARAILERQGIAYEVISPGAGFARVGVPSLAVNADGQTAIRAEPNIITSGWVDYRPARLVPPSDPPPAFAEDIFGDTAIMVLAPCVADATKIRIVAHISGDLTDVFPYLNAEMPQAFYNPNGPSLTFMDAYRMIGLHPHRLAIAKADDIVDAWRTLEMIRCRANGVWARRATIVPSHEMRRKPPALEIYKRLPGTNCKECGEKTCMAFAMRLWRGEGNPSECKPVFAGAYSGLKAALLEICAGLGISAPEVQ